MKNKKWLIILPILIILVVVAGGGYYIYNNIYIDILESNNIYSGITVDNINVAEMTKEEAYNYIKTKKESESDKKSMELIYGDTNFNISKDQLGFEYDYEKAVDQAYGLGRDGSYLERYKHIQSLKDQGENIDLEWSYDFSGISTIVQGIAQKINIDSKDAEFDFNGGNIKITPETVGKNLDETKLAKLIEGNAEKLDDIELPVEVVNPEFTKEFYSSINGIIGEFSTSFKGSAYGRVENIKLSAKALSNRLLLPGDQLSYNSALGPIKRQFGFQEAPVIIAGDLTPGLGGGVCQTSTTLYNALLLADMKILERSPHSIAATYVPKGQDAAVAPGYLDLVFKNEFDFPVYTLSKVVGDKLYFYIYGDTTKKDYTVRIEPEIYEKIDYSINETLDETVAAGGKELVQDGRTGYKVKTYKTIIKDGKVIGKTQITHDYYRERNYVYKIGPEAPAPVLDPEGDSEAVDGSDDNEETIVLEPVVDDPIDRP